MSDEKLNDVEINEELEAPEQAAEEQEPSAKKPRSKKRTIALVVVAVVAAIGIGFWQWHETPGFCAAICHNMDVYLQGYLQEQGVAGHDKYGNEVTNTNAMMAVLHRHTETTAMSEIRCMGCHHPVIGEQISEGISWVRGDYLDPLDERVGEDLTHWWGEPANNFCANQNCHAYLLDETGQLSDKNLMKATAGLKFNPHVKYHQGMELQCTDCHKGHRASTIVCTGCHQHEDIELPDGWVTYHESQELLQAAFA